MINLVQIWKNKFSPNMVLSLEVFPANARKKMQNCNDFISDPKFNLKKNLYKHFLLNYCSLFA